MKNRKKFSKSISAILFSLIICCLLLLSGCSKTKNYGKFYSIKEAYELGIITHHDLMSIAFYNNDGRRFNEDCISEDFTPNEKGKLTKYLEHKIKAIASESAKEYNSYNISAYFGTYGKAIAVKLENSLSNSPAVERKETANNIIFNFVEF